MKYRSRTEIAAMILNAVDGGSSKTKIMYKAYLSYKQLKEYLGFLEERSLIKYEENTQTYRLTERGRSFLYAYEELNNLISEKPSRKLVNPDIRL